MRVFCRDQGQGEPVVLVHGLGASHRAFDEVISTGGYRYLAVDLPGVGQSGAWASSSPPHIAERLQVHLASMGVTRFRLFGHSFGGLVALSLAALEPQAIVSLVVASCPAMGLGEDAKSLLAHPMVAAMSGWLSRTTLPVPKPLVQGYLKWLWGDSGAVSDSAVAVAVENARNPRFLPAMIESLQSIAGYHVPVAALRQATFDKAVLWGERDPLVSVIEGERLAIAIGARLQVLTGVGHSLPEEAPFEVKAALGGTQSPAP